jgi:putative ABC transport system permease protein
MSNRFRDVRHAIKALLKQPTFTLVAVLTLALGIGGNVAIFSVVNGMLLQPLPYANQARVWSISERSPDFPDDMAVSSADYFDWKDRQQGFDDLALFRGSSLTLTGAGEPERIPVTLATANLLSVLGASPISGRGFRPEDDRPGAEPVVIVGHGLWQRRFGGRRIVGEAIVLDGRPRTVIGIMPPEFGFPEFAQLWVPLALNPVEEVRGRHMYSAIGLLKLDTSPERALTDLTGIAKQLEASYPATNTDIGVRIEPLRERSLPGDLRLAFVLLMCVVGFVLLIACANVANLLLGRAVVRDREMAVRISLGASRWRVIRLLLAESLVLACIGSLLGLVVGRAARDALVRSVPIEIPLWMRFDISGTVLVFVAALTALTALTFGLAPALRASRPNLNEALKEAGTRSATGSTGRLRNALVVGEVAIALVLLVASGLTMRAFVRLTNVDPGFDAARVLTMRVVMPQSDFATADRRRAFVEDLQRALGALPGVERGALTSSLPLGGSNTATSFVVEGEPPPPPGRSAIANLSMVTPGYFETMRISCRAGRTFTERDGVPNTPPVAIVNESLARAHWAGADPVGKRISFGDGTKAAWLTVVGVVADVRHQGLDVPVRQSIFVPHKQNPSAFMTLVVKASVAPLSLVDGVRRLIRERDRNMPISDVFTMERVVVRSMWNIRLFSWIFGVFGVVALVLAVIGVYGVVSYSVAQRSREIGIRMALGAGAPEVLAMVIRQGMVLALAGLAVGLVAALAATRVMRALLYGISPTDPLTFAAVIAVLVASALIACYVPARRATKVDPLTALRYE